MKQVGLSAVTLLLLLQVACASYAEKVITGKVKIKKVGDVGAFCDENLSECRPAKGWVSAGSISNVNDITLNKTDPLYRKQPADSSVRLAVKKLITEKIANQGIKETIDFTTAGIGFSGEFVACLKSVDQPAVPDGSLRTTAVTITENYKQEVTNRFFAAYRKEAGVTVLTPEIKAKITSALHKRLQTKQAAAGAMLWVKATNIPKPEKAAGICLKNSDHRIKGVAGWLFQSRRIVTETFSQDEAKTALSFLVEDKSITGAQLDSITSDWATEVKTHIFQKVNITGDEWLFVPVWFQLEENGYTAPDNSITGRLERTIENAADKID